MDYLWILIAFGCGFAVKQIGLPPLVGYLLAGFGLHLLGAESNTTLLSLADLGITLMLFTIGLKLNLRTLIKPEICVTAISHQSLWCVLLVAKWLLLGVLGVGVLNTLSMTWQTAMLVAFALSFSSTVGVIKLLEDQDELKTYHGQVAVGILVIQDIVAVLFMSIALGKVPSLWAGLLVLLVFARPLLDKILEKGGHGELLPLSGFLLALGGAELFSLVNLKGDLGALLIGALVAGTPKATELYKSLMSFKDLFLIGFFLSVGLSAFPSMEMLITALFITLLLVTKFILFLGLFLFLRMRSRDAFLCAVILSNFSEFGLIVANMAVSEGFLSNDWLVIIAISLTFSLIISSVFSKYSHKIYAYYKDRLNRLQWHGEGCDLVIDQPESARIIVVGLGRVGTATYDALSASHPGKVLGIDADQERVTRYRNEGRQVILGDGEDADFWSQLHVNNIHLIMISTPGIFDMQAIIEQIKATPFSGKVACIARFEDERQQLLSVGADVVFNYYSEVGAGFAEEGKKLIQDVGDQSELLANS
jgi:predicted Kef-type K+ transport protein